MAKKERMPEPELPEVKEVKEEEIAVEETIVAEPELEPEPKPEPKHIPAKPRKYDANLGEWVDVD